VHVLRFDIAMHDLLGVDIFECARHLEGQAELIAHIARVAVLDRVAHVFAAQELHDHEGMLLLVLAEIENADDVVVRNVAGHTGFGKKSRLGFRVLTPGLGEDFDGYGASDDRIASPVDVRHAAAKKLFELIFTDSRREFHERLLYADALSGIIAAAGGHHAPHAARFGGRQPGGVRAGHLDFADDTVGQLL